MKKVTILSVAALAAVVLTNCKQNGADSSAPSAADSTAVAVVVSDDLAYINMDSLVLSFDMYNDMSKQFREKTSKIEADINSRGKGLEREMMGYQEKIQKGLVTRAQAQEMEVDLQKKQQEFLQYRERKVAELSEEETVMLNQINHNILDYLKVYNADGKYGMILSTNASGPVLNAHPSLDITKAVLAGLNKEYAAKKAAPATKK